MSEAQAKPSEWRPIESAPLGGEALFWHPMWLRPQTGRYAGDRLIYATGETYRYTATHWMPLPSPPSSEQRED
jgi:hypothetical protein